MTLDKKITPAVIQGLTANTEPWLSCDDCFEQTDTTIDALLQSQMPLTREMAVHLVACPACHEEMRSLASLVAEDYGLTANEAVARLDAAVQAAGGEPAPEK